MIRYDFGRLDLIVNEQIVSASQYLEKKSAKNTPIITIDICFVFYHDPGV